MTIEFILPDIGEGIVECELLEWLVAEGEHIEEDQPVAEVMTDKATVQIPAMHAGVVNKLHYAVGDIAKVHAPLFSMTPDDGEANQGAQNDSALESVTHQAQEENNTSTEKTSVSSSTASQDNSGKHIEDFILPDIGEGIVECEIVKWNVAEGDEIEEDQAVVEVMTDKAVVEIPAKNAGTVHRLYYAQGDIAKVHSALFALEVDGDTNTDDLNSKSQSVNANVSQETNPQTDKQRSQTSEASKFHDGEFEPPIAIEGKVLASPAVRRIAREKNIDLSSVQGSGKKGRILKSDVLSLEKSKTRNLATHVESKSAGTSGSSNNMQQNAVNTSSQVAKGSVRTEKVRGIQAAMAKQMSASVYTIPHFTVTDELVMDNLMSLRKLLKPEFEAQEIKLSFMPFFVKAMSLALNEFPVINSQLNDDASEISYFSDHNIGFAVDSKIGLLVPNIKRVQDLSLLDIAKQMQDIIEQARAGRVAGEHLKGGTISISNIGAIGGITATPVINKPEAAIVALGKTQKLPRFDDQGNVSAQHIMAVNWSGDHRIIDGATMVRFNNLWMSYLTQPEKMLMHLK
ncbi:dihydrolipoyllysine-residue acetyltransferase [Alteromonas gracilis]|uniref:dihydrolipoyllysine-residue acetyltransferase n=1 Tax=Alteromonas gracilis TaxID=1479524 RepID=UPI0037365796